MSDVQEIKPHAPQARNPEQPNFDPGDSLLLRMCVEWRIVRAQQEIKWAQANLTSMWGTLPEDKAFDTKALRRMKEIEQDLAREPPRTVLSAREMLGIAVTILAHVGENPDSVLADGPVLDIVRNVTRALEWLDADTRLGNKCDKN